MQHRRAALIVLATLMLAVVTAAQGIKTKRSAVVFYGSPTTCSQPATIDYKKVRKATPEWKTIRSEGVRKGSARYDLLISAMNSRIKRACKSAAEAAGRDCVVREGDIKDARGLSVQDLTKGVIGALES
ncbi:MAG: hypothetical protein ACYTF5_06750 [Planctomycetota bacterium]|jgi:hypothetical protein